MAQHKWHKEIKAWADGAEIQYDRGDSIWIETPDPMWHNDVKYRIKPQPKEPQYLYAYAYKNDSVWLFNKPQTCLDGIIGKIKLEDNDNGND